MQNTQTLRRTDTLRSTQAAAAARSAMIPALAALLVGALIVGTAGFAWSSVLHNSTHDTRHAFALPCH